MKKYWTLFKISLRNQFADKARTFIWMLSGAASSFVPAFGWLMLSQQQGATANVDVSKLVPYYLLIFISWYFIGGAFGWGVAHEIKNGKLSNHLLRPMFPFSKPIVGEQAWKLIGLIMGLPVMFFLIAVTVGFSGFTFDMESIAMSIPAIIIGAILFAEMEFMLGISALWFVKIDGVYFISYICFEIFGGRIAPLYLLPTWLGDLSSLLPFRYTFSFAVDIFQQTISSGEILKGFIISILWAIIMFLFCKLLMKNGLKKYEAVGI